MFFTASKVLWMHCLHYRDNNTESN